MCQATNRKNKQVCVSFISAFMSSLFSVYSSFFVKLGLKETQHIAAVTTPSLSRQGLTQCWIHNQRVFLLSWSTPSKYGHALILVGIYLPNFTYSLFWVLQVFQELQCKTSIKQNTAENSPLWLKGHYNYRKL